MKQTGSCHRGAALVPQHIQRPAKCAWRDEKANNFPKSDDHIV